MARHRSRSRSRSPVRRKRYDDPRDRRSDRRSPGPSGLLIRNISLSARPEDLRIPFERFGPIKDVYLPKNYYTGEPRGFGFVKFRYPEDAAEAKSHLNHTVIGGREIRIVFAEENRKTPQEMRRTGGASSRSSRGRRSPSSSPRRQYHSNSRSHSPAQRYSRGSRGRAVGDEYSSRRLRSVSRSASPASPRDDRSYRSRNGSTRRSRSFSRSISPRIEKNHSPSGRSPSPRENGQSAPAEDYAPSRSHSPRKNSRSPSRSHSRSYSPR